MEDIIQERLRLIMEKRRLLRKLDQKREWTAEEITEYQAQVSGKIRRIEELDRISSTAGEA